MHIRMTGITIKLILKCMSCIIEKSASLSGYGNSLWTAKINRIDCLKIFSIYNCNSVLKLLSNIQ